MKISMKIKRTNALLLPAVFIICLLGTLYSCPVYSATSPNPAAVELYNQGKFEEALNTFAATPPASAADYFNIANCHYRLGHGGQALAYYEKAFTMAPGNEDIRFNRNFVAQSLHSSGILPEDQSLWSGRIIPFVYKTSETLLWFALASVLLLEACFLFKRWKSTPPMLATSPLRNSGVIGSLGMTALIVTVLGILLAARQTPRGIIAVESAQGRSGPGPTYTELFRLPGGTTVQISGTPRDGWQQVRFSLGNIGWMLEKDFIRL